MRVAETSIEGVGVALGIPTTYMNESGVSVGALVRHLEAVETLGGGYGHGFYAPDPGVSSVRRDLRRPRSGRSTSDARVRSPRTGRGAPDTGRLPGMTLAEYVAREIGAHWPKGRSAAKAVREGRRDL